MESSVLAVVEGLTEYLPVSSTAHIILAARAMGIPDDDFMKNFTVIVQFGGFANGLISYGSRSGFIGKSVSP